MGTQWGPRSSRALRCQASKATESQHARLAASRPLRPGPVWWAAVSFTSQLYHFPAGHMLAPLSLTFLIREMGRHQHLAQGWE